MTLNDLLAKFRPLTATAYSWGDDEPGTYRLNENDEDKISALLMGRRVVKADSEHLILDDGTTLKMIGHEGGCACSAGDYALSVLNGSDNVITRVEYDYHPAGDFDPYDKPNDAKTCDPEQDDWTGHYRIFVYADNERINLMQVDGSDGNGYYGTGFEIVVRPEVAR
jgi:hypothetical protein